MGKYFGTDGIRGIVNDNLTVDLALKVGLATGYVLGREKNTKIIISRDTRYSGDMLNHAIVAGLISMGVEVIDIGIAPTPAVSYLVQAEKADAGIMISASHNPYKYNGIKIFNEKGYKLADELEEEIEKYIDEGISYNSTDLGKYILDTKLLDKYIDFIASKNTITNKNLKIVVDCANGSASTTAEKIFKKIGLTPIIINSDYDGYNINNNCGSTHLEMLMEKVKEEKADLGIAYDGDADRCLFVDEDLEVVDGDYILAICGAHYHKLGKLKNNSIVGTVMSNLGFRKFCEEEKINFEATKVGDRYVLENMLENDYILGGEQSGHILFLEYLNTGDGQLTSIEVLNVISKENKSIKELKQIMKKYPQVLINVDVSYEFKEKYMEDTEVMDLIKEVEEDLGDDGRVLIRPSGTENLVRVMIEGLDEKDIKEKAQLIADLIAKKAK